MNKSFKSLIYGMTGIAMGVGLLPMTAAAATLDMAIQPVRSEKETRDVVRKFRRQKIPLDAVILDIYWFGPDVQGHMGNLDWDRDAWPTPEKMIDAPDEGEAR